MNERRTVAQQMAAQIADALKADGITQAEFARRTGVSQKHLSQVLTGKGTARYAQLDYWAFVLGRSWRIDLLSSPAPQGDGPE